MPVCLQNPGPKPRLPQPMTSKVTPALTPPHTRVWRRASIRWRCTLQRSGSPRHRVPEGTVPPTVPGPLCTSHYQCSEKGNAAPLRSPWPLRASHTEYLTTGRMARRAACLLLSCVARSRARGEEAHHRHFVSEFLDALPRLSGRAVVLDIGANRCANRCNI